MTFILDRYNQLLAAGELRPDPEQQAAVLRDRKSTRLNSSH